MSHPASRVILCTGAGSGIGAAITNRFSRCSRVIAVGRREHNLLQTRESCGNFAGNVEVVPADVSCPDGRDAIVDAVRSVRADTNSASLSIIHNAGSIGQISPISSLNLDSWKQTFGVNVEGPLFLTQALLSELQPNSRILHISSGAAHSPYGGWHTYCASKAALHMIYSCLKPELAEKGSVRPGIIDTPMVEEILSVPLSCNPNLGKFEALKENTTINRNKNYNTLPKLGHKPPIDKLDTAENVAAFIDYLLHNTTNHDFSDKEWDIRDHEHFEHWGDISTIH